VEVTFIFVPYGRPHLKNGTNRAKVSLSSHNVKEGMVVSLNDDARAVVVDAPFKFPMLGDVHRIWADRASIYNASIPHSSCRV
jgi:hypothetical protein